MMAQGEISGLLYLSAATPAALPVAKRQLAHTVAEQVALAISNLHLRETLKEQSIRDPLTGLYNRRYLEEALQHEMTSAQRHQTSIGVIMVDADHFKSFNDTYGHDFGDQVLQAIAQVLKGGTRLSDLACRYGGEEFTLILPQSSLADTATRAEALRQQIGQLALTHRGQPVPTITASLGVACFPQHGQTGAELLQKADQALYQAKAAGRNRVLCAPLEPGMEAST
jgi:diguanylate cyclase (GGDEF)-like protein